MPKVLFIANDGRQHAVELPVGRTLMEGARDSGVPGIDADCGGACACATCHVHISVDWIDRVGKAGPLEQEMLERAVGVDGSSRLSCQIQMTEELGGVTVCVPASQY